MKTQQQHATPPTAVSLETADTYQTVLIQHSEVVGAVESIIFKTPAYVEAYESARVNAQMAARPLCYVEQLNDCSDDFPFGKGFRVMSGLRYGMDRRGEQKEVRRYEIRRTGDSNA